MPGKGYKGYSKKLHKTIVGEVRAGRPKTLAFRLSGLHPDTIWDWLRLARHHPEQYPQYVQLGEDIDAAKAEAEAEALDRIKAAAKSDAKHWTADAWYLERTNPAEYGRRDKVEIEADKPLIQLNQVVLSDPDVRELSRAALRLVTGLDARPPLALNPPEEES